MTGIRIDLSPGGGRQEAGRSGGVGEWGWLPRGGWRMGGVVGGLLLLLLMGNAVRITAARYAEVQARYEGAVADSIRLGATLERLRELRVQQDSVRLRLAYLTALEGRVSLWSRLLMAIADARPAYAWIDRVQTLPAPDTTPGSVRFRLLGIARSTNDLAAYMSGLAENPNVEKLTLAGSEPGEVAGRVVQHFALEGEYVASAISSPPAAASITAKGEE